LFILDCNGKRAIKALEILIRLKRTVLCCKLVEEFVLFLKLRVSDASSPQTDTLLHTSALLIQHDRLSTGRIKPEYDAQ
jgi:hypothetical protein